MMMKLGGRCIVQKSRPSSNVSHSPLGTHPQKCGVGLRCWENQRFSSFLFLFRSCSFVHITYELYDMVWYDKIYVNIKCRSYIITREIIFYFSEW